MTLPRKKLDRSIWKGRRVLLSGHTGFKGAWMGMLLRRLGAVVTGVSLARIENPSLFATLSPWTSGQSIACDIRDWAGLKSVVEAADPEIVIHMAAQALVREAYADPVGTISSNVMGTVNLLDVLRRANELSAVLVITSDKVYENGGSGGYFTETARLGGHDPYSASKAAAEIVTSAYRRSFYVEQEIPVLTARAGNVIGGGDWARDRLVPDLWRAYESGIPMIMRNPIATRPWQHVLDPLYGYLLYIQDCLLAPLNTPVSLNFGPPQNSTRTVRQIAEQFSGLLNAGDLWTENDCPPGPHESAFLAIDSSLALNKLGWLTALSVDQAIQWTCDWYSAFYKNHDMRLVTYRQIDRYAELVGESALLR